MFIHQSCSSCCHSTTGSSFTGLLHKLLACGHDIMTQVYGQCVTCFQTSWKHWWSLQRTLNVCLTWTTYFLLFSFPLSVFYSAALVSVQLTALQFLWPSRYKQIPCSLMRAWLSWIQQLVRMSWILNTARNLRTAAQRQDHTSAAINSAPVRSH